MTRSLEAAVVTAIGLAFGLGSEARSELAHAQTSEPFAFWFAVAVTVIAIALTGLLLWAERVAPTEDAIPKAIARRPRAWQGLCLDAGRRAS